MLQIRETEKKRNIPRVIWGVSNDRMGKGKKKKNLKGWKSRLKEKIFAENLNVMAIIFFSFDTFKTLVFFGICQH